MQNFPVLHSAIGATGSITISGRLDSTTKYLNHVSCPSANDCFAVGDWGTILAFLAASVSEGCADQNEDGLVNSSMSSSI